MGNAQKEESTTKYSEQIQTIVDSYDQIKLTELYNRYSAKQITEKEAAVAYALIHNIPVKKYNEDGSFDELQKIAPDGSPIYFTLHNVNAAISTRANYLNTGGGLGLTIDGDGLTAYVWDGGPTRPTHQEFDGAGGTNRVTINDGVTTLNSNSFHAQHVTGTIVASGFSAAAKGMAWKADALTYDWNNDVTEATTAASSGMLLSNHSYGFDATIIPNSWFGQYGSDAREWDDLMYNAPYYLQIKSAGNDGADNTSNGNPLDGQSSYDKLNGDACAKNNLVIANGQDANIDGSGNLVSVTRNSGSSEGPTDDYRIKPDIMGNGTLLTSTFDGSDSAYGTISGTSMSAPNVTGTLLLLQDYYFDVHGAFMRAATLKGLALHTADDVSPAGPDAQTGWGLLNAKVAAETIAAAPTNAVISELTLSQGQTYQVTIQADGVNPLMASISWTDPAGTINSGTNSNTPALVNDLDIRLDNGTSFTPWRLTGVTTNGTGDNIVDPYERIDISGASGQYTLSVTHKGTLSGGSQNFSLIVTGGIISVTSPEISYDSITAITTEQTDCSFTDVVMPVNIAMAPSQDADVTFTVAGGTATNGVDFDLLTSSVTFLQGQTTPQNITVRVYHDGFAEVPETIIIDFTVNANGGDATANTSADSLKITINDDDVAPASTQDITLLTEDFEDWTGWLNADRDGDGEAWKSISFTSGGLTGFSGQFAASETDLTVLGGSGSANADNYLISPQMTIPAGATNTAFTFSIAGYNDIEHYRLQWTTDISSYATIDAGTILEERDATANVGDVRIVNNTTLAGQTGYFVIRHYNSAANNGLLFFDALDITVTIESPVQTAVNTGTTNDQIDLPGTGTMYTSDSASGDVMLDITNSNTHDFGCVNVSVSRAGTGAQSNNGSSSPNLVMDKTFDITPTFVTGSGSTGITFYFTEAEIAGWEAATGLSRNVLTSGRYTGGALNETSTLTIGSFASNVTLTGTFTGLEGTYLFGPAGAFVSCPGSVKTWNGSSWSPTGVPDITNSVVIAGPYNTDTDGDIVACDLTINLGTTLTIPANSFIDIYGNITVNGNLVVEHQGSVVQTNSNALVTKGGSASINVELTTPVLQTRDFMVLGSPMSAETRTGVYNSAFLVLEHTPASFLPHPGVPAGGTNFADDNNDFWTSFASGPINVGEGYIVRPQSGYTDPANTTFDMTYTQGTLNNGDVMRTVVYNGAGTNPDGTPNALANPYASAISASQFISDNALVDRIYFWEHLTPPSPGTPGAGSINFSMDDISMYIDGGALPAANDGGGITTPNGVIATGQGFGIKIKSNLTSTVTFKNSMRLTTGNTTLRNSIDIERILLKVRNENYGIGSYALVAFNPLATSGLDSKYDAERLATTISLYSQTENETKQLGIQSREAFDSSMKISMGFASQVDAETLYTISIAEIEGINISNTTVFLVDNLENVIHNLSDGDYEFKSDKGTFNQRFTLMFEEEVVLGADDHNLKRIVIFPNPAKNILNIVSPQTPITSVEMYDVGGRVVNRIIVKGEGSYQMDISALETAIYFVKIHTENGSITKRVVKY